MTSQPPRTDLRSYVPALLAQRVAERRERADEAWSERFDAVLMIADISGFTALAERLAQRGRTGVEELSRILNVVFGEMVEIVEAHGGDILRFAGDAPIVVWRDAPVPELVAQAASCGLELQTAIEKTSRTEGLDLSMRVGISAGRVLAASVGGIEGRWELVVVGEPVLHMAHAERRATQGQVVLHRSARDHLTGDWQGEWLDGSADTTFWSVRAPAASQSSRESSRGNGASDLGAARAFIPRVVLDRLDAGQAQWLAELRRVTVLFVSLRGLDIESPDAASDLHQVFRGLQTAVYEHGGSINQFLMDDKGVTLVAAWGLPGRAHEDDAQRALRAATAAGQAIARLGSHFGAGVASGRVFCGSRGNESRREYALIGSTVNLAARLMVQADDAVLCDQTTHHAAPRESYGDPIELSLKGVDVPVSVFPILDGPRATAVEQVDTSEQIVGRAQERERIARCLQAPAAGRVTTLWIEGEAGIGKSVLLADTISQARALSLKTVVGTGDSISASTPYHAIRVVLEALFGLSEISDSNERRQRLVSLSAHEESGLERAPLLGAPLGLSFAESSLTQQMKSTVRADAARELIVSMLRRILDGQRVAIVVDDGHWVDSASWALFRAIQRQVPGALLAIASRPLAEDAAADAQNVRDSADEQITLGAFSDDEVAALVRRRLRVDEVPAKVERLVAERSAGHPLFAVELASSLRDSGLIVIEDGRCEIDPRAGELDEHQFPDTVQGVVLGRIDRLPAREQLTLKVASVIGPVFPFSLLGDVHPVEEDRDSLREQLTRLERSELAGVETPEPDLSHVFRHAIIHEVAYGLMVSDQRKQLHRAVAQWYEREHADAPPYALLAHHWLRAEDDVKSLDSLEQAGREAAAKGAAPESARYYKQALSLAADRAGHLAGTVRQASWERGLSAAYHTMGQLGESAEHAASGLRRLWRPLPRAKFSWFALLGVEASRQALYLTWPFSWEQNERYEDQEPSRHLEAAGLFTLLMRTNYVKLDVVAFITASLAAINLAEKARFQAAAAESYSALAYIAANLRLKALARRWWRFSQQTQDARARIPGLVSRGLYAFQAGDWRESECWIDQAVELARVTGDRDSLESALAVRLFREHEGGQFDRALATAHEIRDSARGRENPSREMWGVIALVSESRELGEKDESDRYLAEAESILEHADHASLLVYHALKIESALYDDRIDLALTLARDASSAMERDAGLGLGWVGIYVAMIEAHTRAWAATSDDEAARAHRKQAWKLFAAVKRNARIVAYARPRAWILESRLLEMDRKPGRALQRAQRALERAEEIGQPVEQALAHEQLARLADHEAARARHLKSAYEIYVQINCRGRARRLEAHVQTQEKSSKD